MNRVLIAALVVSVVVLAVLGGYYFWLKYSPTTSTQTLKGFTKAQELLVKDKDFITSSRVQLNYQGTIKNMEPGENWTIENNGKTLTISQVEDQEIRYSKAVPGGGREEITQADIKVGDKVAVLVFIDSQTGTYSVYSITVMLK